MPSETTRREILKGGLSVAALGLFGVPEWALPVLAQGDELVPFTDIPANFSTGWAGWITMMVFLGELAIGLAYAWKKGALDWE